MGYYAFKILTTVLLVVLVSEIARRSSFYGALLASVPLVSVLAMIWLYVEKAGTEKISNHAFYTFWYVLPTLPMFLALPKFLAKGINFWLSLLLCMVITVVCFAITVVVARRFGVELMP